MKALVTGGAGFIGNAIVKQLLRAGWKVVVIDSLFDSTCRCIDDGFEGTYQFISMDVADMADIEIHDIDVVYHFAAHYANVRSLKEPLLNVKTNMIGTMAVLEFCRKNKVTTLMYASTSGVYGGSERLPFSETDSICPSTPYECTKYAGEILCSGYCKIYNISLVAPRFFNVYGPGDMPGGYRSVVPNFFKKAFNNEDILITGKQVSRDFTYIDDVVNAVQAGVVGVLHNANRTESIYNIATNKEVFIIDLAEAIKRLTNSDSKIMPGEMRNWDNAPRRVGSNTLFTDLLPDAAKQMRNISDGLEDSLKWYGAVCR